MLGRKIKLLSVLALPLIAAGCVSTDYAAKDAGFLNVSLKAGEATGKQTVWVQNQQHAQVVRDRVKTLMKKYGTGGTHLEAQKAANERLAARRKYTPAPFVAAKPTKSQAPPSVVAPGAETPAEEAPADAT